METTTYQRGHPSPAINVIDVVALHINPPSVTSRTKHAGNVGNWATSNKFAAWKVSELSNWSTPIVPVVKPNGAARICGDYKITVNTQLQTEEYPLPRIDDIFAKLAGGKKFTKIDHRQAYHQMGVEEESQEYLTINTHQGLYR